MGAARRGATLRSLARWPLWAKPALAIASALVLGLVLSSIDVAPDGLLGRVVFRGSASDARQLLATVTSTMITVTSVVFVLTVVALQIASTQFSPRLLRSFLRDGGTQLVLSTFVGTVAYSLAGLHTVGTRAAGEAFVPRLAVSGALALALFSVAMLVYYITHITNGIRIDTIMSDIEARTLQLVRETMPSGPPEDAISTPPERPPEAHALIAPASGYVQRIAPDAVANRAVRDRATVVFTAMPGFHVVEGRPVGWVVPGVGAVEDYQRAVGDALIVDRERKIEQDIGFGLRQLVDIAGRGLSPSYNDPYSAVQAIHHATVVLTEMARRHVEPVRICDDGAVRVFATEMDLVIHLQTVCSHVRWSMAHRPNVALALLLLLENVRGATGDPARCAAIETEIGLILDEATRLDWHPAELATVREAAVRARTGGDGRPCLPTDER